MIPAGGRAVIEVIVVNFNAGDALTRCVSSVLSEKVSARVTVVDNASTDGSAGRLEHALGGSGRLKIIASAENQGFARAVNAAVAQLDEDAEYLLILNPDCEVLPGAIGKLVAALAGDHEAALAGPVVVDRQGQPMKATLRSFPTPWASLLTFTGAWRLGRWIPALEGVDKSGRIPAVTTVAEAISGACMLIRRRLFEELGRMDESYGLHCEDLDLMYRASQRGMHCLLVPSAKVFHDQGLSSKSRPSWVHWQKHRGMQRFFHKFQAGNHSLPVRWLVVAGIWTRFIVTWPLVLLRR